MKSIYIFLSSQKIKFEKKFQNKTGTAVITSKKVKKTGEKGGKNTCRLGKHFSSKNALDQTLSLPGT